MKSLDILCFVFALIFIAVTMSTHLCVICGYFNLSFVNVSSLKAMSLVKKRKNSPDHRLVPCQNLVLTGPQTGMRVILLGGVNCRSWS